MKTIGRIVLILLVAAVIGGGILLVVNANSSSLAIGRDRPGGGDFRRAEALPGGFREGFRPEDGRGRGGFWIADVVKNLGIISLLVALIVVPRRLLRKSRPAIR